MVTRGLIRLDAYRSAVAVLGIGAGLLVPRAVAEAPGPATATTVYLQHIGENGKPIRPLVVTTAPPAEGERERMLGPVEAQGARVVTVSAVDAGEIIDTIETLLEAHPEAPATLPPGTFRVTLVEPGGREASGLIAPEPARSLLASLEAMGHEGLAAWVASVTRRPGAGEVPTGATRPTS